MEISNLKLVGGQWQNVDSHEHFEPMADIIFVFGDREAFKDPNHFYQLKELFPSAKIVGCSSSGNVLGTEISEAPIIATAVKFNSSYVQIQSAEVGTGIDTQKIASSLVSSFQPEGLKHIFVLSDGLLINGSELVKGLNSTTKVSVSGGMAGDGDRFEETWIIADSEPAQGKVVAVGFYGDKLTITSAYQSGWSEFGAERVITKSKGNVLYEIDNEPALDLYKKYLGDYATGLPNSGLRFPLSIKAYPNDPETIRTLLGISEEEKSITFAGDVPENYIAKLMKPDIDSLIDGAGEAAQKITVGNEKQALGLVVSCVGRRIIMKQLAEEELESVEQVLGSNVSLTGFYSYGEISPFEVGEHQCQLHNQTMTLTVVYED